MPVFNKMVLNGTEYILGGGGNIGEPLNLTVTTSGLDATITWEDNEIGTIPPTTFQKSELVRKIGSAPTSPSDGDLVVTETVKDTYKTTGYVDQGLTDGETYYYVVFSYSDLGGISYCDAVSVTPSERWQPGANTILYYPMHTNLTDEIGNYPRDSGNATFSDNMATITTELKRSGTRWVNNNTSDYTIMAWIKSTTGNENGVIFHGDSSYGASLAITSRYTGSISPMAGIGVATYDDGWQYQADTGASDTIYHVAGVKSGTDLTVYVNGIFIGTISNIHYPGKGGASGDTAVIRVGTICADIILEDKTRTAQEVADYFDLTKGDYGIS